MTVQAAPAVTVPEVIKPKAEATTEAQAAIMNAEAYMSGLKEMSRRRADPGVFNGRDHADDPGRGLIVAPEG